MNPREHSVASWNMQGGSNWSQVHQLRQHDMIALQESGTPPFMANLTQQPSGVFTGQHNFGSSRRPDVRHVAHWQNDINSHARNSLTVLSTEPITNAQLLPAPSPDLRPGLMVETHGINLVDIHAPSGNHNAAAGVTRSILNHAPPSFLAMGDFNAPPRVMSQRVAHTVTHPTGATQQSGNTLDYAIHSPDFHGSVGHTTVMSDHWATSGQFQR